MIKEQITYMGAASEIAEKLVNAVSLSPKVLDAIFDFHKTPKPNELTNKFLSSLLQEDGFDLEYTQFHQDNINAQINITQDDRVIRIATHLLIENNLDTQNRIYLRALAYLALTNQVVYPKVITEYIKQSRPDKIADKWLNNVITKQLQSTAKPENPCMQGILEATHDLRKPTLCQAIFTAIKRKIRQAQPLQ